MVTKAISAEDRIKNLDAFAHKFNKHLIETPGVVLDGKLRWAVAVCARDALLRCQSGCGTLGQDACMRPGTSFEAIADLKHEPGFPLDDISPEISSTLTNLVHTVINHQNKVDATW